MKKPLLTAAMAAAVMTLVSCGGGGGSSTTTPATNGGGDTTAAVSGVVVDPYIEGAVFCVDENTNGACDAGEPTSTASTASGVFSFTETPADGSVILMQTAGTHNGVPYSYDKLKGIYSGGDILVTPVTTLFAKGITAAQLAEMFDYAGLTGVTADAMLTNPMDGLYSGDTINAANLAVLKSSVASYMFLRIIEGSTTLAALTGAEIYASAMDASGAVYEILSNMATVLNQALDANLLTSLKGDMVAVTSAGLPAVTFADVVATAVAIADKLATIGYTTCNATAGTDDFKVSQAVAAVGTYMTVTTNMNDMITKLGPAFYMGRIRGQLSQPYIDGVTAANATFGQHLRCASGSFVLDDAGNVTCYAE